MVGESPEGFEDASEITGALPVLSRREIRALLSAPDRRRGDREKRDAALLAVLVLGGLRATEARTLTLKNVEARDGRVRLRFKTLKRKNHWRIVTLPPLGAKLLASWLAVNTSAVLFPGQGGKPISLMTVERVANRYLAQIGRSDLTCHGLRHTALSTVMEATSNLWRTAQMAGHASTRSTEVYLAWSVADADANADALAGALRLRRARRSRQA